MLLPGERGETKPSKARWSEIKRAGEHIKTDKILRIKRISRITEGNEDISHFVRNDGVERMRLPRRFAPLNNRISK